MAISMRPEPAADPVGRINKAGPASGGRRPRPSRGGLTTKLHLNCDGKGRPLSVVMTPGQRHESTQLPAVLKGIRVKRIDVVGRRRDRIGCWRTKGTVIGAADICCAG